jgi:hypothetical protein
VGAEIGGHAGDAMPVAALLASVCDTLATHPNVVNASDVIEIPANCLYVEGSVIARLLQGQLGLQRSATIACWWCLALITTSYSSTLPSTPSTRPGPRTAWSGPRSSGWNRAYRWTPGMPGREGGGSGAGAGAPVCGTGPAAKPI